MEIFKRVEEILQKISPAFYKRPQKKLRTLKGFAKDYFFRRAKKCSFPLLQIKRASGYFAINSDVSSGVRA